MTKKRVAISEGYYNVRAGIVELLQTARSAAARNVNSIMTAVYWDIGRRIVESEQAGERRAGYGEVLIQRLARDLSGSFGRGFGPRNLAQMRSFYLAWPPNKILQTTSAKSIGSTVPVNFSWGLLASAGTGGGARCRSAGLSFQPLENA